MESLKNCKNHESEKRDKYFKIFTKNFCTKLSRTCKVSSLPVEPFMGDGAAKMFDFMWFLMERGVDAESTTLPAKMSLLPPPKEQVDVSQRRKITRRELLPGGFNTLQEEEENH